MCSSILHLSVEDCLCPSLSHECLPYLTHLQEVYDDDDDCEPPQFAEGSANFQDTFVPFVDETRGTLVDASQLQQSDPDTKIAAFSGDNLVAQPKKVEVVHSIVFQLVMYTVHVSLLYSGTTCCYQLCSCC